MKKFYELWEKSVIVQSVLTIGLVGVICAIVLIEICNGVPPRDVYVPPELLVFASVIIGYWFKKKDEVNEAEVLRRAVKDAMIAMARESGEKRPKRNSGS